MRRKGSSAPRGADQAARGNRAEGADGDDVVRAVPRGARTLTQAGSDRRTAPRVLVNLEVDYRLEDNYLFAYITDISATGIFVRTTTPEPAGTRLNLRFMPRPAPTGAVPVATSTRAAASQRIERPTAGIEVDDLDLDLDCDDDDDGDDGDDGDDFDGDGADGDGGRGGDRHDQPLELEGEVIWVNPFRPGAPDSLHPGMGIRFVALDDETRRCLIDLVRRFAYLG